MFPGAISSSKVLGRRIIDSNHTKPHLCKANIAALKPWSHFFVPKITLPRRDRLRVSTTHNTKESTEILVIKNGEEGVSVLGQETFIVGSPEARSYFGADEFERTLNRLSKWLVSALFVAVILRRQDAEACWTVTGTVINTILCATLKRILNQKRPAPQLKSDSGMPSSHAQSIFFAVVFVIFSIGQRLGINEYTIIASGLTVALGSYLSSLRVKQPFHTASQVVVGAAVGSVLSILWFWLWVAFVRQACLSSLGVRFIVSMGAAVYCVSLVVYMVHHWIRDK